MPRLKRALLCANPDLNYIDGSSIWAQTLALVLADTGLVTIDVLARSTPQRPDLFAPLRAHPAVTLVDGSRHARGRPRLSPDAMAQVAVDLDRRSPYDLIVVRGQDVVRRFLEFPDVLGRSWVYLTDIPQSAEACPPEELDLLRRIGNASLRILCQTPGFRQLWREFAPALPDDRFLLYPPVIPDIRSSLAPIAARDPIAVYAGKFSTEWMTLQMAETWPRILAMHPRAELHMIGDKIHTDARGFEARMLWALRNTPGLIWHGAMPRTEVQGHLERARVGLSWRAESLNHSLEYSTKVLEYGGAGCAAILNRTPVHEQLLGADYPLYANSPEEYLRALDLALSDNVVAQTAADRLLFVARSHTFTARVQTVREWLLEIPALTSREIPHRPTRAQTKTRVLVAGHDLKFFTPLQARLEATGQFEFLIDRWRGHTGHDEATSRALLRQADVILCEWCLGNLVWYSRNRLPHQRLIARFHLQERNVPYLANADWNQIDHIVHVSAFAHAEAQRVFRFPVERTSVIPNYLDSTRFFPRRKTADARYTLGLIGYTPAMKRLDRALDLLQLLLQYDSRYRLRVKGRHPFEYQWVLNRPDEVKYYHRLFERINSSPSLSRRVIFDPAGNDVPEWLTLVGYILSMSDFEAFHMSVGEGMLSGCQPVIWAWKGADDIWGAEHVVQDIDSACQLILNAPLNEPKPLPGHLQPDKVVDAWVDLLARARN